MARREPYRVHKLKLERHSGFALAEAILALTLFMALALPNAEQVWHILRHNNLSRDKFYKGLSANSLLIKSIPKHCHIHTNTKGQSFLICKAKDKVFYALVKG